jgi:hypothetical protein
VLLCARQHRLAVPLGVALTYLTKELEAAVPVAVIEDLLEAGSQRLRRERAQLVPMLEAAPRGLREASRLPVGWRDRWWVAVAMAFPSPGYVRWAGDGRAGATLPVAYASRLLGALRRVMG